MYKLFIQKNMVANIINSLFYNFDYSIMSKVHIVATYANPVLLFFSKVFSVIGNKGILFFIIAIIMIIINYDRNLGIKIVVSLIIASILGLLLKSFIARPRPFESDVSDFIEWWTFVGSNYKSSFSFPSGHVTMITAYMMSIIFYTKRIIDVFFGMLLIIAMSLSRVYLMLHYPSDCIAGFIVGLISAIIGLIIVNFVYDLIYKNRRK